MTQPDGGLSEHVGVRKYSLRLQRYWWAACKIDEEARRAGGTIVVVDLGCERGWLKRFTRPDSNIRWVGVDGDTSHPSLAASNYDEVVACNFHEPFPLPDRMADVVVSLHVFEHLRDPDFTASEVARILRPGGVFLAGSPASPAPIASVRTRILEARDRAGKNRHWGHLRKFSPAAWDRVCTHAGLGMEFLTGSHLIRWTGAPMENRRWWVRFNQLWGGLFPSLGQEVYLAARKPKSGVAAADDGRLDRLWLRVDWAAPLAAVLALAVLLVSTLSFSDEAHPLSDEIARQQDGNDIFYWCPLSRPEPMEDRGDIGVFPSVEMTVHAFSQYAAAGRDLHLIVRAEHAGAYLNSSVGRSMYVADEWIERGQPFLILTMEGRAPSLVDDLSKART